MGAFTGSRPTGQAPAGLVATRIDPERWLTLQSDGFPVMVRPVAIQAVRERTFWSSSAMKEVGQGQSEIMVAGKWNGLFDHPPQEIAAMIDAATGDQ